MFQRKIPSEVDLWSVHASVWAHKHMNTVPQKACWVEVWLEKLHCIKETKACHPPPSIGYDCISIVRKLEQDVFR